MIELFFQKHTFRMLASQLAHESTLADGGETNEATVFTISILPFSISLCRRRVTYTLATPVRATSKPAIERQN